MSRYTTFQLPHLNNYLETILYKPNIMLFLCIEHPSSWFIQSIKNTKEMKDQFIPQSAVVSIGTLTLIAVFAPC